MEDIEKKESDAKLKFQGTWKVLLICFVVFVLALIVIMIIKGKKNVDASEYITKNAEDHVKLGKYKGMTYTQIPVSVTNDEIEEIINDYIEKKVTYSKDEERQGTILVVGDIINCSYICRSDSEEIENGSANFELGSGEFPELEAALLGQVVGDTINVTAVIPEDYKGMGANSSINGKSVDLELTLNFVNIRHDAELTDELASEMTGGKCTTVSGLSQYFYDKLLSEREEEAGSEVRQQLISRLIEESEFTDIDWLVDKHFDTVHATYEELAKAKDQSFDEYVQEFYGNDAAEFDKELRETMEELVKEQLVLQVVADKEKLRVKKKSDEYKEYIVSYMEEYHYDDEEQFLEDYDEDSVLQSMTYDRAIKFIMDNARAEG